MGKDKLIQGLFQKIEVLTSRLEQAEKGISDLKAESRIKSTFIAAGHLQVMDIRRSQLFRKRKTESKETRPDTKAAHCTKLIILIKL